MDNKFAQLITPISADVNHKSLISVLKSLSFLMRSSQNRNELTQSHWDKIYDLCRFGLQILSKAENTIEELESVAEIFRLLRNCCGGSETNYTFIINSPIVFEFAKNPLYSYPFIETPERIAILKICIQFFGNLIVLCGGNNSFIWTVFFKDKIIKNLLHSNDESVLEYSLMVLYNSMTEEHTTDILISKDGLEIVIMVINILMKSFIDWGMLFVEHLLKRVDFFENCFCSLPLENRLLVLDIIVEQLKCSEMEENIFLPIASVEFIKNKFINLVGEIAQLKDDNSNLNPCEFVKMLSLLCSASVCNAYIPFMLTCQDLLQKSIETLKCIHLLGKEGTNFFSSESCLKLSPASHTEQIISHPLYCFKKDLVKLIGNLCYGCKDNQDLVRMLDGIPLVLDCCKLDAKNPYIMQWCILAIRNIVEHNQENQAVLAGITATGEIADASFLKNLGLNISILDGKLTLS